MIPAEDEFLFLPLGGTGEIGMNFTLYGHDGAWIVVDVGITFGGEDFPDYEILMADPEFIEARLDRLAGIVLTHAHEDHVGALPYLWRRLRCPIYATPFTAALVRTKLAREGMEDAPVIEIALDGRFQVGPFTVEYVAMTHSIPEPNGLLIETPVGAVFHTGDWKLDDHPVVGERYDHKRYLELRRKRLLAMICDSTNAVVPGSTGSEASLFEPLRKLGEEAEGRLVVTAFASNVARLVTLARVAEALGRHFGVIGPAMERMVGIASQTGYWPRDLPERVEAAHLGHLPRSTVLAVCTGSQGERRSALAKMSTNSHPDLLLDPGDTVIFSSRLIPGNELSVERIQCQLLDNGIKVVTDEDAHVHVSGHPAQDDLRRLYNWVRPPAVIPVHGTPRHLAANARIAEQCHVPRTAVVRNGDLCRLTPEGPKVIEHVPNGRLTLARGCELKPVPAHVLADMREQVH